MIRSRRVAPLIAALALAAAGCSARRYAADTTRLGANGGAASAGDAAAVVGTWRLVEFWDRDSATAPLTYRYGERPTGYFVYDPTGHVSILLQRGPTPFMVAPQRGESWFDAAAPDELRESVEAFRGYFGTYSVDMARGIVVHQVEGDSRGLYTGSRQSRTFRLVGDSLIIGNDTTTRRVLLRVRQPSPDR